MPEPEIAARGDHARTPASADPGRGHHPPRMEDVASLAGVSHQTVSRVLNDFPKIRPATRDRVLAAIDELGYDVTRRPGHW